MKKLISFLTVMLLFVSFIDLSADELESIDPCYYLNPNIPYNCHSYVLSTVPECGNCQFIIEYCYRVPSTGMREIQITSWGTAPNQAPSCESCSFYNIIKNVKFFRIVILSVAKNPCRCGRKVNSSLRPE